MKIGIIAGNRMLPVELSRGIKQKDRGREIVAICFKGETSPRVLDYCDKAYWIYPGQLSRLRSIIKEENLKNRTEAFELEIKEGTVFIGQEILAYKTYQVEPTRPQGAGGEKPRP